MTTLYLEAENDLACHFRGHGEAFTDGQVIDTLGRRREGRPHATVRHHRQRGASRWTDLRARPVFHHTRESIQAHLTIVFAALAVARYLQDATGMRITPPG